MFKRTTRNGAVAAASLTILTACGIGQASEAFAPPQISMPTIAEGVFPAWQLENNDGLLQRGRQFIESCYGTTQAEREQCQTELGHVYYPASRSEVVDAQRQYERELSKKKEQRDAFLPWLIILCATAGFLSGAALDRRKSLRCAPARIRTQDFVPWEGHTLKRYPG